MSEGTQAPQVVELTIPMLPDMELTAVETASSIASYLKFEADDIDEIKMALIEAIINAFEHSKSDVKKVFIQFVFGQEHLTIAIQDHGNGFDLSQIEKPNIKEKLKSDYKRGWGLMLIENLMDRVQIDSSDIGTTLVMSKKRNSSGGSH